jgi:glycosyltransferase involved in cell wall biosynthesis
VDGAINLQCEETGHFGNPARNAALEYLADNNIPSDDDWIYVLDDDNILHPDWYENVKGHLADNQMIHWGQCWFNHSNRTPPAEKPIAGKVDTAQYMVRWSVAKHIRFQNIYEADGFFAEDCFNAAGSSLPIHKDLGYYNFLRPNKGGDEIRAKLCMISMFKNEAGNIRRMLDSVAPYIDFWVLQDNGSTDGTSDIVNEWAQQTRIPGMLYKVEEGWVNFGWNRDHLLQTTLKLDHGCDWIMKMDCDETLEVDEGFDWSIFWTPHQSFHVTAVAPGIIYYRAWIWNARLPWKFNHDPAHETIYLDIDGIGENFHRYDLPRTFRMRGGESHGESYTVPTKYVTDALKLEEKLIRENTMLTDLYHFWYIGKSYEDCFRGDFFPLRDVHQQEYARRCAFYFKEVVRIKHNNVANGIDEMAYYALCGAGNAHRYLKEYDQAIECYNQAIQFCPPRNDHLVYLAEIHWELRDYKTMLHYTQQLVDPGRTLPFPTYFFLINTNMYVDSGQYPHYLHKIASDNVTDPAPEAVFAINTTTKKPRFWIVDDFYSNPDMIRKYALSVEYHSDLRYFKGRRSVAAYRPESIKLAFERVMNRRIENWDNYGTNGVFQICTAEDPQVYHWDNQRFAAMIYLAPGAALESGTRLHRSVLSGARWSGDDNADASFSGGYYDSTKFDIVDSAGNVYNRLVIMDASCIHSAGPYFGQGPEDGRLTHLFFFD